MAEGDALVWDVTPEEIQQQEERRKKYRPVSTVGMKPTEITFFDIENAKDGGSKNIHLKVKIFAGPDEGIEHDFLYFSEKLKIMMVPLLVACGYKQNPNGSISVRVSKETLFSKRFLAEWIHDDFQGKKVNKLSGVYAPLPQ